jgi:hypothetical protein
LADRVADLGGKHADAFALAGPVVEVRRTTYDACYPRRMSAVKTRIMYIQRGGAPGRIGRVRLSKAGRTIFYGDLELASLRGRGYKANYIDLATNESYWVSGPRKDGQDTLYAGRVEIDADVREEYWREVRRQPSNIDATSYRSLGVHGNHATR